jgi:hypothetical protein
MSFEQGEKRVLIAKGKYYFDAAQMVFTYHHQQGNADGKIPHIEWQSQQRLENDSDED